jgi:HAE1 family hydrophobic/amphiphilic exporter-1
MNLSSPFIMRPVMTTLVMAAFIIFGIISYNTLAVNDLPAVDFPTITVSANIPGANADTVASAVATPLEKQFSLIGGLESMNSTSSFGSCSITLSFDMSRSIDGAAQDVQSAIIAARPFLPTSMPTPPTLHKVNPSDAPILFIALSSPTLPLYTVDEYAENVIATRLSMVSGVAQVQVYGSQVYSPHVQVDPRKLAAYGIGIDQVATAVRSANVNLPCGTLYGQKKCWNVMANGQLFNAAAFRPIIVTYKNGSPVRLQDVGDVIDSVQTDKVASWFNNTRAVILAVQRQPNTNTIQIVDNIKTLMPTFRAIMPGSINLNIMFDRSIGIRRAVDEVKRTLLITIILVVMVIFLFLGDVSTTVIASLALPISLLGTFAAMKLFGFTINNISLMALTLCVGFVVDDAIVVLENIARHMEKGEPALMAAMYGSKEICFTIVSMTISLIAVFIPILLMGGIIGRLFFEFGVTISTAILISGFVSITLTPMLCSRFLRPPDSKKSSLHLLSERVFSWVQDRYETSLRFALHHKIVVIILFWLMVGTTVYLMNIVPKGFMPSEDTGMIMASTQAAEGVSFEEMVRHQKKISQVVSKDTDITNFMSSVGAGGPNSSTNQGRMFLILKPKSERKNNIDDIVQDLRKKTANIPGIKLYLQNRPSINIGGQQTKATFQFTLSGPDLNHLYTAASDLEQKLKKLPDLQDVNSDMQIKNLQLSVQVDRDKCARLGISLQQVQDELNSAYSSRQISVIYTPTNQYWVILEVQPQYYRDPSMMSWFFVRSNSGQLIPLFTLAKVERSAGPLSITHLGQFPSVTLSFNLKPGVPLGAAVSEVKELVAKGDLPEDVTANFQGTAKQFESSISNLGLLLTVAILVIYIVLGILYESFIHPITILSGLPSAGLGAVIMLYICHLELNIYSFLGLILLIGIVKKNAIMMIDFALEKERADGTSSEEAIFQASIVRFRPIMMTTMAALLGSLPIAIGIGEGSESRQPLGLTIVGGLLVSQIVTLYITPVFYIYLDKMQRFMQRVFKRKTSPTREGAV